MTDLRLKRSLTWVQGAAIAVGAVLGSGVLILPAITAQQAGSASIVAWVLMSLLAFPLASTLGRLGSKYPHAGGIVEYARLAFGDTAGRMTAWLFLGTIPVGVPIVALVGASYAAGTFSLAAWTIPVMAAVMLLTSLILHWQGVNVAAWMQMLILVLIAGLMVIAIAAAASHMRLAYFKPTASDSFLSIGTSAVEIFWCFVGWEMVGHLAEEFRDPARDLRRVFLLAPFIVGVLYVALSIVTVGTHAYGGADAAAPLSQMVGVGLGNNGAFVTGLVALLITLVAIHGNLAGFSRMMYSQARAGVFPEFLGRLHPRHQTPVGAIVALAVDFAVVLSIYTVFQVHLAALIAWPSVVFLILYVVAMLSAWRLLKNEGWRARVSILVPLVVCIALYPLSGWATVYPVALAVTGWLMARRGKRRLVARDQSVS